MPQKPCHLQSPETEKSNIASRRQFWKWRRWQSKGFYPYKQVLCCWSWHSKEKLKLQSGIKNILYGRQPFWEGSRRKSIGSVYRDNQYAHKISHSKSKANVTFAPETMFPTDGRTNGHTDWHGDSWIPPSNFIITHFLNTLTIRTSFHYHDLFYTFRVVVSSRYESADRLHVILIFSIPTWMIMVMFTTNLAAYEWYVPCTCQLSSPTAKYW